MSTNPDGTTSGAVPPAERHPHDAGPEWSATVRPIARSRRPIPRRIPMTRRMSFAVALGAATAATLTAGLADAHNAAHFFLPDGTCHEVGSNRDAPIVGAGNPNQSPGSNNLPGQLDLIPGNGDQYGARYAAERSPRLLPGNCP
jgi:hypothetical protein